MRTQAIVGRARGLRMAAGCGLALCLACLLAFPVHAQAGKSLAEQGFKGMDAHISVDLRGIDVVEALKFLATKGNLNIVASKEVAGTVHLLMDDVTVGDALETVLAVNRLAYTVKGGIISVVSENEYRTQNGVSFYDERQTKVYTLKYASAKDLATMLQPLKSETGLIVFNDATGVLILKDIPAKLQDMDTIIQSAEIPTLKRLDPTVSRTYTLQYAKLEEILPELSKEVTPTLGAIKSDKRTNTLIVTDLPHQVDIIEGMIRSFDRKAPEVFIEARIVEVTLSDGFDMGIDWGKLEAGWRFPVTLIDQGTLLSQIRSDNMKTFAVVNQDIVLDMLKKFGDTKVLSDPRITVENGHEATLKVVTSEAYEAGNSEVDSGGVTTSYKNYTFVEVGVSLSVIPTINQEQFISMLIKPEVSTIADWYGGTGGSAAPRSAGSVPIVKKSTAETTVSIKDGVTIMIAGLINESKSNTTTKVPWLGDIPGLGKVFQHQGEQTDRRETIIFLTPHIVDGAQSLAWDQYGDKEIKDVRE